MAADRAGVGAGDTGGAGAGELSAADFELRPMRSEDIAQVVALERRIFSDPWSRVSFEAEVTDAAGVHWTRCAWRGERLAGYIIAWFVLDEVHLANLAVLPMYRHLGLASRLVETLVERAREQQCRWIGLEVRRSNRAAQALYAKHGFRQIGIRKNYYRVGREDALVMARELDQNGSGQAAGGPRSRVE